MARVDFATVFATKIDSAKAATSPIPKQWKYQQNASYFLLFQLYGTQT